MERERKERIELYKEKGAVKIEQRRCYSSTLLLALQAVGNIPCTHIGCLPLVLCIVELQFYNRQRLFRRIDGEMSHFKSFFFASSTTQTNRPVFWTHAAHSTFSTRPTVDYSCTRGESEYHTSHILSFQGMINNIPFLFFSPLFHRRHCEWEECWFVVAFALVAVLQSN